jgi:tetratricopeptide (TPR) repeat protein
MSATEVAEPLEQQISSWEKRISAIHKTLKRKDGYSALIIIVALGASIALLGNAGRLLPGIGSEVYVPVGLVLILFCLVGLPILLHKLWVKKIPTTPFNELVAEILRAKEAERLPAAELVETLARVLPAGKAKEALLADLAVRFASELEKAAAETKRARVVVPTPEIPAPQSPAESSVPEPEILTLQRLLDQSLDAKLFIEATKRLGFRFVSQTFAGLAMESDKGSYMLAILQSIHPANIAVLVYSDKRVGSTTTLVDNGKREYAMTEETSVDVAQEPGSKQNTAFDEVLAVVMSNGPALYATDRDQAFQWYAQKGFPQHDHNDATWLRWYDGMAQTADAKGIWDEAWAAFHHALAGYLAKNAPDIPRICWRLGRAHIARADYDQAPLYLEAGQRLSDPEQDINLIGMLLIEEAVLSYLAQQPQKYETALERLIEYFVLPSGPGASVGEEAAQSVFRDGHTNHGWLDATGQPIKSSLVLATGYYQVSLDMNRRFGNKQGIAFNLANLGDVWRKLGDLQKALACWREALTYIAETGDQATMEKVERWMSELPPAALEEAKESAKSGVEPGAAGQAVKEEARQPEPARSPEKPDSIDHVVSFMIEGPAGAVPGFARSVVMPASEPQLQERIGRDFGCEGTQVTIVQPSDWQPPKLDEVSEREVVDKADIILDRVLSYLGSKRIYVAPDELQRGGTMMLNPVSGKVFFSFRCQQL